MINKLLNSPIVTTWSNIGFGYLRGIIVLPLILVVYNNNEIAIWLSIGAILVFSSLFAHTFSSVFIRVVSFVHSGARDLSYTQSGNISDAMDSKLLSQVYNFTNLIFLVVSALIGLISYPIVFTVIDNLKEGLVFSDKEYAICISIVIGATISVYQKMYTIYYYGLDKIQIINQRLLLSGVLALIIVVLALLFKIQFLHFVILNTVLNLFIFIYISKNIKRDLKINTSIFKIFNFEWAKFTILTKPIKESFINQISYHGTMQGFGIYIAANFDPFIVGSYLLTIKLITMIKSFSNVPLSVNFPKFSKLMIRGKFKELNKAYKKYFLYALSIYLILASLLVITGGYFLTLINSDTFLLNSNLVILIVLIYLYDLIVNSFWGLSVAQNKIIYHHLQFYGFIVAYFMLFIFAPKESVMIILLIQNIPRIILLNIRPVNLGIKILNTKKVKK